MRTPHSPDGGAPSLNGGEPELRLLDLAAVLLRSWKLIAACVILFALGAGIRAAMQPPAYTAGVVLVPSTPGSESRAQMLASQLNIPLLGRAGGGNQNLQLVEAILRSRSLRDSVARRVVPDSSSPLRARVQRVLAEQTVLRTNVSDRSVQVDVTAHEPALAARVANQFAGVINEIATRIAVQTAIEKRAGLEQQLEDARDRLSRSEEALRQFEKSRGAPAVQEQARASLEAAAELQRAVTEQEIRVSQLMLTLTPDHPQLRAARSELAARRGQLSRAAAGRGGGGVMLGQNELPDVKLAYTRLFREYTKDEQIYLGLTAALAGAQSDANDDLAVVTVLDTAVPPAFPSGPRVKLAVIVGLMLGAAVGLVWALLREGLRRARREPESPFFEAWDGFKDDVSRVVPGRSRAASRR